MFHGSVQLQHPEQDQAELVVLPAVDDDVDAGVQDKEQVGDAGQYFGPNMDLLYYIVYINKYFQ